MHHLPPALTRRSLLAAAAATAFASPLFASAENTRLRMRIAGISDLSKFDGTTFTGFEIDTTREIGIRSRTTFDYLTHYHWRRAMTLFRSGRIDIMTGISYRKSRLEFIDYIGPFDTEQAYLVTRHGAPRQPINTLDALAGVGRSIMIDRTAAWNAQFDERLVTDPAFSARFTDTAGVVFAERDGFIEGVARQLLNERVVGAVMTWYSARDLLRQVKGQDPDGRWHMRRIDAFGRATTYIAARRTLPDDVRSRLKTAYTEVYEDGRFLQNWKKWFQGRPAPTLEDRLSL